MALFFTGLCNRKHVTHSLNCGHATPDATMVFLVFCDAIAMRAIAGVNLHNARTQAIIAISLSGEMLWQIPHLTAHNSTVKVKTLRTSSSSLRLAEAAIATLAKLQSADMVLVARMFALQLTCTNNLNL